MKKPTFITADWKDIEGLAREFIDFIEGLGYRVYEDPSLEGSDTYGWIISPDLLTNDAVEQVSKEHWDPVD